MEKQHQSSCAIYEEQTRRLIKELAQELRAHCATHNADLSTNKRRALIVNMTSHAVSGLLGELKLLHSEVVLLLEGLKFQTLEQCMPLRSIPIQIRMGKPPRSAAKFREEPTGLVR